MLRVPGILISSHNIAIYTAAAVVCIFIYIYLRAHGFIYYLFLLLEIDAEHNVVQHSAQTNILLLLMQ